MTKNKNRKINKQHKTTNPIHILRESNPCPSPSSSLSLYHMFLFQPNQFQTLSFLIFFNVKSQIKLKLSNQLKPQFKHSDVKFHENKSTFREVTKFIQRWRKVLWCDSDGFRYSGDESSWWNERCLHAR